MTYQIQIKLNFRAGHRLVEPYKGKCNNVHGEGYTAIVIFENDQLDENGMVLDFGKIKKEIKEWIDDNWDHAYIHSPKDEIGHILWKNGCKTYDLGMNPTAENMAEVLFDIIKGGISYKVIKVGIIESFEDSIAWYESPKSSCEVGR